MDFDFTSEQTQLADTVRRLVEKDYSFEARKQLVVAPVGSPDGVWPKLVDLGLTALPMPEEQGGFAGGAVDLLLVMQELGRGLVSEPYFATVFAAEFIKLGGSDAQRALLEGVAAGDVKMAAALGEPASRHDLTVVGTTAEAVGDGYLLDGRKSVVLFGAQADRLIVSARLSAGGLALFVVDAALPGIVRNDLRTLDGQRVAEIFFGSVKVDAAALIAQGAAATELLDAVTDYGIALLCAEAVGVMEAMNAATLDYAKTRKQFGQPIGRFQVLQHRMVEMFMHLEQARSMAYLAAVKVDAANAGAIDARERRRIASAAKVRVGQAARYVGQQAVQIHGGMGVTNELPAAHLFKRLTMIDLTLGDIDHHLQRFIAASDRGVDGSRVVEGAAVAPPVVDEAPLQRAA